MANISYKNFVNINIQPKQVVGVMGTRDTIALLTDEGTSADTQKVNAKNYTSLLSAGTYPKTNAFLKTYFDNGGINAYVVCGVTYTAEAIAQTIADLDDELIVVAFAYSEDGETDSQTETQITSYDMLKSVAQTRNADTSIYGINEKIIVARSINYNDTTSVKDFAIKYSNNVGAEMTIGAYLSQIEIYGTNTIKDYAFTEEDVNMTTEFEPTNTEFEYLMDNNYNVDVELQGITRNAGGNDKEGESLINNFTRIVLHQTLTERLLTLLATKIKSTDGVSKMYATIVDELEYYRTNGYLTTDKVWEYDDLVIDGITIIEKGTPLLTGYQIKIFPMSSLTPAQKQRNEAPPVYIVLADQYVIRVINIGGEVI